MEANLQLCLVGRVQGLASQQMDSAHFDGVYAALLTPRTEQGAVDPQGLRRLLRFLLARGITQFAVNGATGEYCLTTADELACCLDVIREEAGDGASLLCGVGSASLAGTMALVHVAESRRVDGLLLPMPSFFRYEQGDLATFSITVAAGTALPILLYNLPQFTNALQTETVLRLVEEVPNIVGIKDSSGSLEILRELTRALPHATRMVGNDSALVEALASHQCDGVVSGVACAMPELIRAIFSRSSLRKSSDQLAEFLEHLNAFPTPWGLKLTAQVRGACDANLTLPLSSERTAEAEAFCTWMRNWLPQTGAIL